MTTEQKLLQAAIETIIPDSVVQASDLVASRKTAEAAIAAVGNLKSLRPNVTLNTSGIIRKLIPTIPSKVLPSPADLQTHIDKKIDELKVKQQRLIMEAQSREAKLAERAFTLRKTKPSKVNINPLTGS